MKPSEVARNWLRANRPTVVAQYPELAINTNETMLRWFVARTVAEEYSQMGQRELANLLMEGVAAVQVSDLNGLFDERRQLELALREHFGI